MPTQTPNYSFQKPIVGSDKNTWGGFLNDNWDSVDGYLATDGTGLFVGRTQGGTFSGNVTIAADFEVTGATTLKATEADTITASGLVKANAGLDVDGNATVANGVVRAPDGAAATPSYTFSNKLDTGLYFDPAQGVMRAALGGESVARFDAAGTEMNYSQTIVTREKGNAAYLGVDGTAADSNKLGGKDADEYAVLQGDNSFTGIQSSNAFRGRNLGSAGSPTIQLSFYEDTTGFYVATSNSQRNVAVSIIGNTAARFYPSNSTVDDDDRVIVLSGLKTYLDDNDYAQYPGAHSANETDFPLGTTRTVDKGSGSVPDRGEERAVYLGTNSQTYTLNSGQARLSGRWASCGGSVNDDFVTMQRFE